MTRPAVSSGLIIVDKPAGWTSHDVVGRLRRLAGTRKVGHAGTLDPMATGVLVVGIEKGTRLLTHLVGSDKGYDAVIRLGVATTTDDAEGEVLTRVDTADVRDDAIVDAVKPLSGRIDQVPSAVSAIKVNGVRAYKRVRNGEAVALAARSVTVHRFDVATIRRPPAPPTDATADGGPERQVIDIDVHVECSSGTYVRALARDLGAALGVGGHLTMLRRTRVDGFTLDDALDIDRLAELDDPVTFPLAAAVARTMPMHRVSDAEREALSMGQRIAPAAQHGIYAAVDTAGEVVAVCEDVDGQARPVLVFSARG